MINWIILSGTIFDIETTDVKLDCLIENGFDI